MVIRVTQILIFSFFFLTSCSVNVEDTEGNNVSQSQPQLPVKVKYAQGFLIDTLNGYQRLQILDAVNNEMYEYYLVPKGDKGPEKGVVIHTPVNSMSLFSVSFVGFLNELNALDRIKYVENINFVYNEKVHKAYSKGEINESGLFGQINLEKVILDAPEVILLNGFSDNSNQQEKLVKAGISIVSILEWYEQDPLARAEWVKVFGALLDKEAEADSVFQIIESNYLKVKNKCAQDTIKTKAIFSSIYQGVWYLPGGKSYVANLLKDANGTYHWVSDNNTRSIATTFEDVILNSPINDVWINPDANSLKELYTRDGRYEKIVNNLTIGVFQSNARINSDGGNDYWESGVVRPDLILRDYGKMLYPDRFQKEDFFFFKELN